MAKVGGSPVAQVYIQFGLIAPLKLKCSLPEGAMMYAAAISSILAAATTAAGVLLPLILRLLCYLAAAAAIIAGAVFQSLFLHLLC